LVGRPTMAFVRDTHIAEWAEFRMHGGVDYVLRRTLHSTADLSVKRSVLCQLVHVVPCHLLHSPWLVSFVMDALDNHASLLEPILRSLSLGLYVQLARNLPLDMLNEVTVRIMSIPCLDDACATMRVTWPNLVQDAESPQPPVTTYECPIGLLPCVYPVWASDGHTYEAAFILRHLASSNTSPMTRELLAWHSLMYNADLVRSSPVRH